MSEKPIQSDLIVFIDDDEGPMEFYEEALQEGEFRVKRIRHLKEALEYIQTTDDQPALWLFDLMMPIEDDSLQVDGRPLIEVASLGLSTGRVLYRQIRKRFPNAKVVLLTNMSTPKILDDLEAEMDENASSESKMALMPSELVQLIKQRIGKEHIGS